MTLTPPAAPFVTGSLAVPGARLHYEVRGSGPLVVVVGAPMDAAAFTGPADLLSTDHTVVTTDPRGINRSVLDDPAAGAPPEQRADDLAALIAHLGGEPAAGVFGSSGGAVSVLALAERHPSAARVIVAHEPPLYGVLPDRAALDERTDRMIATYRSGDRLTAWRIFMENAGMHMPEPVFQAMFGTPPEPQARDDERFQFEHMLPGTVHFEPDPAALRAFPGTLVLGIGEQSAGQLCDRATRALAATLGLEPTMFPGGHAGFLENPPAFVTRLRDLLPTP